MDIDPAAYIKLCSATLLACKDDLFLSQITPLQALSAIAVLPVHRTLDWNDQVPLPSVLGAVPVEVYKAAK